MNTKELSDTYARSPSAHELGIARRNLKAPEKAARYLGRPGELRNTVQPFTAAEALDMALCASSESVLVPAKNLVRILVSLQSGRQPTWLRERMMAIPKGQSQVVLTNNEIMTLAELVVGKSGRAFQDALGEYAGSVLRGYGPRTGAAASKH
jgi:hypothetical protein